MIIALQFLTTPPTSGFEHSLAFNYEGICSQRQLRIVVPKRRFDAADLGGMERRSTRRYNFPGGAKGVLESNEFDLEGYSADDQPTLYFNYFLENDASADRLRFYVVTEQGVEHLVSSNNTARGPQGGPDEDLRVVDDEFDDPFPSGVYDGRHRCRRPAVVRQHR